MSNFGLDNLHLQYRILFQLTDPRVNNERFQMRFEEHVSLIQVVAMRLEKWSVRIVLYYGFLPFVLVIR